MNEGHPNHTAYRWQVAAILILAVLAYSNTFSSPFTLDDYHVFAGNSRMFPKDLGGALKAAARSRFGLARFIPMLSFAVENHISNGALRLHHLSNLIIHLLNAVFVYLFISRLLRFRRIRERLRILSPRMFAVIACGMWTLNPVQTNAVTYIVQRMASLCCLFYLASLTFYITGRQSTGGKRTISFMAAAISSAGAFLSKENSATLPLAVILTEWAIDPAALSRTVRQLCRNKLLMIAFILALPLVEHPVRHIVSYSDRPFTLGQRLLTEPRIIVQYISLLVMPLPSRLSLEHDPAVSTGILHPPGTLAAIVFLTVGICWSWRKRQTMPLVWFGTAWFFLNLIIESTVVPLELMFEHRLYLPSIGLFIAITAIFDRLTDMVTDGRRHDNLLLRNISLGVATLFAFCALLTYQRNQAWTNDLSLYQDMVRKAPNKPRVLIMYANVLIGHQRYREALKWAERGLAAGRPNDEFYYAAVNDIFLVLKKLKGNDYALNRLGYLLARAPTWARAEHIQEVYHNAAVAFMERKEFSRALEALRRSLALTAVEKNLKTVRLAEHILNLECSDMESKSPGEEERPCKIAVPAKMARLCMEAGDYGKAAHYIGKLTGEERRQAAAMLASTIRRNLKARTAMSVDANLEPVCGLRIKVARFILDWYRPLWPLVPGLLNSCAEGPHNDAPGLVQYRAIWLVRNGHTDDARDLIAMMLKRHPSDPGLLLQAFHLFRETKPELARNLARRLLAIYPGIPGRRGIMAFIYRKNGVFALP